MAQMIGRLLVTLVIVAVSGFAALALIGAWDGYEKDAAALGFSGPFERYLASRAGFPHDPQAYRAASKSEQWPDRRDTAALEE